MRPTTRVPHVLLTGTLVMLAACSTPQRQVPASPPPTTAAPSASPAPAAPPPVAAATNAGSVNDSALLPHLDAQSPISTQRKVLFDFDDAVIKSEFTPLLERHGRYLAANPALAIRVEGHTDERGSAEYNLALGQKRAQAVVQSLQVLGVKPTQLEAVSWGEERQDVRGGEETAWAQNRRAELRYPSR
ncbi:MAG: OmpA family protein [Rubrivivax sp.]|nr:OmpA family protein [Rubrivivax sp.]